MPPATPRLPHGAVTAHDEIVWRQLTSNMRVSAWALESNQIETGRTMDLLTGSRRGSELVAMHKRACRDTIVEQAREQQEISAAVAQQQQQRQQHPHVAQSSRAIPPPLQHRQPHVTQSSRAPSSSSRRTISAAISAAMSPLISSTGSPYSASALALRHRMAIATGTPPRRSHKRKQSVTKQGREREEKQSRESAQEDICIYKV